MKKTIVWILTLTLALGLLAGCSGESKGSSSANGGSANNGGAPAKEQQTVYLPQTMVAYDENDRQDDAWNREYDAQGNVITHEEPGYTYTYTYDADNRKIAAKCVRANGSVYYNYAYTYDDRGNVTLRTEELGEYYFEYAFTYNDQNQRTQEVCTRNGEHFSTDTYTYDDLGRLIELKDGTISTFRYVYSDNTVAEQDVSKDGTRIYAETITTYDDNGKIMLQEFYEEGEKVGYLCFTREADGRPLEQERYDIDDGEQTLYKVIRYTYDENGNLTEKTFQENGQVYRRLVYTYTAIQVSPQRAQELQALALEDAD